VTKDQQQHHLINVPLVPASDLQADRVSARLAALAAPVEYVKDALFNVAKYAVSAPRKT
jgi:hypothetical protein